MFTGIVEEMGRIISLTGPDQSAWDPNATTPAKDGWVMIVQGDVVLQGVNLGDSIAVNGVCLTVTTFDLVTKQFTVGLSPETLRCTNLGDLKAGDGVNLERSVTPHSRMGGHFVQGHVDGTGIIQQFKPDGDSLFVTIQTSKQLLKYIVRKGYIAVDGTSLTVVNVDDTHSTFNLMLVAYTQTKIVLPTKKVNDRVNLEVDMMGKYIERFLSAHQDGTTSSPVIDALAANFSAAAASSSTSA